MRRDAEAGVSAAVRMVDDPAERSELCRSILEALPQWFGLPESVADYVRDVASLPTFAVEGDAFLALRVHTPQAAEIHVMGVRAERHGHGLGTALLTAAEGFLRDRGIEYLEVKTLGPSHPSEHYAATRRFYESRGFAPLEETTAFWGEQNPCLIMVKHLGR